MPYPTNHPIRLIPLGGLGEIGKNMMVVEYNNDIVIIDSGISFPEEDTPGIDIVIPNMEYIEKNKDRVRALLVTHGHEDHIGAIPQLLSMVNIPVYAPRMATELIRKKLKQAGILSKSDINIVSYEDDINVGELKIKWFPVCHSIPDSYGISIDTPHGKILHTGDFKIDHDPVIGNPSDLSIISELSSEGVFLLLSDSTYAEYEGYSGSDRDVVDGIFSLIGEAHGRVIISSFASQISRIQIILDAAESYDRRVALVGRSMRENTKIARALNLLAVPEKVVIPITEANSLPDDQIIIITTGSQGESSSGLVRISRSQHREVQIHDGDLVILSANTIPGNEISVNQTINNLVNLGAVVITNKQANTHVSGHARRNELRLLLNMTKPKYFVPIHGESRMLKAHANLSIDQGVHPDNAIVIVNGDVLELDENRATVVDHKPAGDVVIDGLGTWDKDGNVIVERKALAKDGIVGISLAFERHPGNLKGKPKFFSYGFVDGDEAKDLFKDAIDELYTVINQAAQEQLEWAELNQLVRTSLQKFFIKRTKRNPLIVPISIEI